MTNLDHFESAFRSASKLRFEWDPPSIRKLLVVTDLVGDDAEAYAQRMRAFLSPLVGDAAQWRLLPGSECPTVPELHALVDSWAPDLICTYRNLHSSAWSFALSLGEFVQMLTQATAPPVLLTPHPKQTAAKHALINTDVVMAMTDHLAGSARLVNFAVAMTQPSGKLWLSHVEDERAYARLIEVISKIPQIDTDTARDLIKDKLLAEPLDYVEACKRTIAAQRPELKIKPLVLMGHHLETYRKLVRDHEVDLLVMNTKDDEQLAMHGMAYPLAIEIRDIPLLLL